MYLLRKGVVIVIVLLCSSLNLITLNGELSDNQFIESNILKYELQYRVYTPPNYHESNAYPVMYVTDGQWYLSEGKMDTIVDELILKEKIDPIIVVFIDNRDTKNLHKIRRNDQFFCNQQYLEFVKTELIPAISDNYSVKESRDNRGIMGMSFGGLNAGFFGMEGYDTFGMVVMQSPAFHPCPGIYGRYKQKTLPLKIFLSTGTVNDTEKGSREMRNVLEKMKYDYKYMEVEKGHDWDNWRPLIDDALLYFFAIN